MNRRVQGQCCQRYAGNPTLLCQIPLSAKHNCAGIAPARRRTAAPQQQAAARQLPLSSPNCPTGTAPSALRSTSPADGEIDTDHLSGSWSQRASSCSCRSYRRQHLLFRAWQPGDTCQPIAMAYPSHHAGRALHPDGAGYYFPAAGGLGSKGRTTGNGRGFLRSRRWPGQAVRYWWGWPTRRSRQNVPRESWDVPLDFVATDTALHCCQGATDAGTQSRMITPACNSDAGAATVSFAAIGSSSVTSTPTPNAAIRISNKVRFTFHMFTLFNQGLDLCGTLGRQLVHCLHNYLFL